MELDDDEAAFQRRLEAKFVPDQIRATLGFAGLYQIVHEMLKQSVLIEVRECFRSGFDQSGPRYDEEKFQRRVLALAPESRFKASLLWLVEAEAISLAQADRLDDIYAHRHALSHELIRFVVDPDFDLDLDLFIDAVTILKALDRFWARIARDAGIFDRADDGEVDDAVSISMMVLQRCINAYAEGLDK
ncbi:hypothetical protein ACIBM3_10300 [Rhodococcus erythropolis]|uniref:hypothetical protein n=1 Tax=Rhodococcus erythropolis TaxID=1833 RepID=UPI0037A39FAE